MFRVITWLSVRRLMGEKRQKELDELKAARAAVNK